MFVARNRMCSSGFDDQVEKTTRSPNFGNGKGFDGEETDNDCDDKSMDVVSQKGSLNATDEGVHDDANRQQEGGRNNVHPGPICHVSRPGLPQIGVSVTTHRAEIAALAPRSMLAIAMMLLIKHNTIQTICPSVP